MPAEDSAGITMLTQQQHCCFMAGNKVTKRQQDPSRWWLSKWGQLLLSQRERLSSWVDWMFETWRPLHRQSIPLNYLINATCLRTTGQREHGLWVLSGEAGLTGGGCAGRTLGPRPLTFAALTWLLHISQPWGGTQGRRRHSRHLPPMITALFTVIPHQPWLMAAISLTPQQSKASKHSRSARPPSLTLLHCNYKPPGNILYSREK